MDVARLPAYYQAVFAMNARTLSVVLFKIAVFSFPIALPPASASVLNCREVFSSSLPYARPAEKRTQALVRLAGQVDNYRSFAIARYSFGGTDALKRLQSLSPEFGALIVDPGLVIRIDEFESFVRENRLAGGDPWSVREAFSRKLGTRVVYRAMVVDYAEHQRIMKHGIASALLRNPRTTDENIAESLSLNLSYLIERRIAGRVSENDSIMSVSDIPEISASAAAINRVSSVRNGMMQGGLFGMWTSMMSQGLKSVYLYEIKVPEIDIIFRGDKNDVLPTSLHSEKTDIHVATMKSGIQSFKFDDRRVESFILLNIEPTEIVSARPLTPFELSTTPTFTKR